MALPGNISKDHLFHAIGKIDKEGIPPGSQSKFYDVEYNGRKYPPKLIVSYANEFANGKELDRTTFSGGKGTPCFKLLEEKGFTIVPKEDITPLILAFLDRVDHDPDNLKSLDFTEEFKGLKVEVGFGQGNKARIPWIALLGDGQKVSKGIYPVYLYFKQQGLLVLALGVSETHTPDINWHLKNETVDAFFRRSFGKAPKRYGDSLVFATYPIVSLQTNYSLNSQELNKDLNQIIQEYSIALSQSPSPKMQNQASSANLDQVRFKLSTFLNDLQQANLFFSNQIVLRFVSALATKPFVILTGLSGSGKTKLAIAFAKWVASNKDQVCLVPVGADWTNREPLLGFPNMQQKETYVLPENGVLNIILQAIKNPGKPYFLILDEMNLSHVERYFADFLSCMESGEAICLHPGQNHWNGGTVPPAISLPNNLFIIGTVNVDETTYMFSPKVLDRASVIEFRISVKEMSTFLNNTPKAELSILHGKGANMSQNFIEIATERNGLKVSEQFDTTEMMTFFEVLKKAGAEFGYRTASEIVLYASIAPKIGKWDDDALMDAIIMQKLLPKVHGSRRKLDHILKKLATLCLKDKNKDINDYLKVDGELPDVENDKGVAYKLSLDKIQRMYSVLVDNSSTSYAEA